MADAAHLLPSQCDDRKSPECTALPCDRQAKFTCWLGIARFYNSLRAFPAQQFTLTRTIMEPARELAGVSDFDGLADRQVVWSSLKATVFAKTAGRCLLLCRTALLRSSPSFRSM